MSLLFLYWESGKWGNLVLVAVEAQLTLRNKKSSLSSPSWQNLVWLCFFLQKVQLCNLTLLQNWQIRGVADEVIWSITSRGAILCKSLWLQRELHKVWCTASRLLAKISNATDKFKNLNVELLCWRQQLNTLRLFLSLAWNILQNISKYPCSCTDTISFDVQV